MKLKQCGKCGNKTMMLSKVRGPFPWKDFSAVTLTQPLELLKCSSCGELGYRPKDAEMIDRSIEATIRALSGMFIENVIAREKCSQLILAAHIGITAEYLSGIKTGTRTPGFQTFNFLKTLAEDASAFRVSDPLFQMDEILSELPKESYEEALKKLA
jgi:hypothetical protein